MLVNGLAPILAPIIGGPAAADHHLAGLFVVLAAIGAVLFVVPHCGCVSRCPRKRRPERALPDVAHAACSPTGGS